MAENNINGLLIDDIRQDDFTIDGKTLKEKVELINESSTEKYGEFEGENCSEFFELLKDNGIEFLKNLGKRYVSYTDEKNNIEYKVRGKNVDGALKVANCGDSSKKIWKHNIGKGLKVNGKEGSVSAYCNRPLMKTVRWHKEVNLPTELENNEESTE